MKAVILSEKAIAQIILTIRASVPNRTREKDREYLRQLIKKLAKELEGPKPYDRRKK